VRTVPKELMEKSGPRGVWARLGLGTDLGWPHVLTSSQEENATRTNLSNLQDFIYRREYEKTV